MSGPSVIARGGMGAVRIDVFTVEPGAGEKLLAHLSATMASVMRHLPGFVSANLHRSLDGKRVTNYAQWRTARDFEAAARDPRVLASVAEAAHLGQADAATYELAHVQEAAGGDPVIVEGSSPLTLVVVMKCVPGEQDELVRYLVGIAEEHSVNPGFISCSIHRSLDGTRIAEYIQWRDQSALAAMAQKPRSQEHFARVAPRSTSAVYEVSKTFGAGPVRA